MSISPSVVIVDLDGTLALNQHRYYLIDSRLGKPNWKNYFLACDLDRPNLPVIEIIRSLSASGHKIHIFSARGKVAYSKTIQWLNKYKIHYDNLTMREVGDFTSDEILKKNGFLKIIQTSKMIFYVSLMTATRL